MRLLVMKTTKVIVLPLLVLLLITSCVGTSPKENFYTLNSQNYELRKADDKTQSLIRSLPDAYIYISAVTIDELVDRPQLVINLGHNQVQILEQQRWAQPLKNQIGQIVAQNLSTLLNTHHVTNYPASSINTKLATNLIAFKVQLNVQQFESSLGSNVTITINYTVHKLKDDQTFGDAITCSQPITGGTYNDLMVAHSNALGAVSNKIAKSIAGMAR